MLHDCGLLAAAERDCDPRRLREIGAAHARGEWRVTLELEDGQTALETLLTREDRRGRRRACTPAGRATTRCSRRCASTCATRSTDAGARRRGVADALDGLATAQGTIALPGYTHMQQAMPSTVALWAGGFAAEIRDDARDCGTPMRRIAKNPLGSAAGYGTPNLPVDREHTRAASVSRRSTSR